MICLSLPFDQPEVAIFIQTILTSRRIIWLITRVDNQAFVNTEPKLGRLISNSL